MEKITEKYYLGSNKNTFILYEKRLSVSGKESYKNIGYLPSLDAVYNAIVEKEVREDLTILKNIETIKALVEELKQFTINYFKSGN